MFADGNLPPQLRRVRRLLEKSHQTRRIEVLRDSLRLTKGAHKLKL